MAPRSYVCSIQTPHFTGGEHGCSIHIYTPSDNFLSKRPRPWSANAVTDKAFVYASLLVPKPSRVPAAVGSRCQVDCMHSTPCAQSSNELLLGAHYIYYISSKPQCSDGAVRRMITGHDSARDRSSSLTSTFSRAASSSTRAATSGLGSFSISWRSRARLCLFTSPGNLFCSDGK